LPLHADSAVKVTVGHEGGASYGRAGGRESMDGCQDWIDMYERAARNGMLAAHIDVSLSFSSIPDIKAIWVPIIYGWRHTDSLGDAKFVRSLRQGYGR